VKHWAGLETPEAVRKAAELLTDHGWLIREEVKTAGRTSETYRIHPTLLKQGKP
jgi:putative DNA primase/helicase